MDGLLPLVIASGSLAPPLAAKSDMEVIIGILWIAFMVIGGIYNWIKKQMELAREKEAERRRAAGLPSLEEAPPSADPLQEAAAADADDARRELRGEEPALNPMRRAPDEESFEEYAARQRAERVKAQRDERIREREEKRRAAVLEKERLKEEDERHQAHEAWERRNLETGIGSLVREVAEDAPLIRVAPVVTPMVAPVAGLSGVIGAGPILPSSLGRLTEAQRLLVGAEIFGRPKMLRPGAGGRRRGPAAKG